MVIIVDKYTKSGGRKSNIIEKNVEIPVVGGGFEGERGRSDQPSPHISMKPEGFVLKRFKEFDFRPSHALYYRRCPATQNVKIRSADDGKVPRDVRR